MKTLTLTINVTYDLNDATIEELKALLMRTADRMAGEGALSGYTDAEVDTWSATVSEK